MISMARFEVPIEWSSNDFGDIYSHDLQLYQNVPLGEIMLSDLQEISLTRLKVLILVERIHLQKLKKPISQRKIALIKELHKEGLNEFANLIDNPGCKSHTDLDIYFRRRDHISHFVLRSAVAFNKLKKYWFFKQETRLFKWRFSSLDDEGIKHFIRINNLDFLTPIDLKEKIDIAEYLHTSYSDINNIDSVQFYKVPFCYVSSLVKKRKVFIARGEAFIPEKEIVYAFVTYFKRILISNFENAREIRANLYDDERFTRIFGNLENIIHIENAKSLLVQEQELQQYIKLDQLDKLSETSYPLCMKLLHKALKKNHHLTHGGRIQYGLFLKGIGISLSDAMTFWKSEFVKIMSETAFDSEHKYQIRFIFGWEGSRRDYQPYNCSKIMQSILGHRDNHGCPFKYLSSDKLEGELSNCGLRASERSAIMTLSKDGKYEAACNRYYEIEHNCLNDTLFEHPNVYFSESLKHHISNLDHDLEIE